MPELKRFFCFDVFPKMGLFSTVPGYIWLRLIKLVSEMHLALRIFSMAVVLPQCNSGLVVIFYWSTSDLLVVC